MEDLELPTPFNDIVLPSVWEVENKSSFIDIDPSGLKVSYTDPNENKAIIIRANHPIPLECVIYYFEIEIIDKGNNGMIGVGYCTKQNNKEIGDTNIKTKYIYDMLMPGQKYKENKKDKENKEYKKNEENVSWGCGYHGDDGYSFCSGSGEQYGPTYTTGDIIGCYLNFLKKMVFYTKNGVNLGIACHLPDDFKGIIYPCVGFRSQGVSVKANFGRGTFKYSAMINKEISKISNNNILTNNTLILKYQEKVHFIIGVLVNLTGELTKSSEKMQNIRGHILFLMGEYNKALEALTKLIEIEPDNIIALRYRGEIYYIMKKYNESIADLEKLLKIKPGDEWATKAHKLVKDFDNYRDYLNDLYNYRRDYDLLYDDLERFQMEFRNWTSDNPDIDEFIKQTQLNAEKFKDIIEWIPFNKLTNIKYLAKGGFGTVFKATWTDGYICGRDGFVNVWLRNAQTNVCLKGLDNSKDIIQEFLNEIRNQHKHGGNSAIKIYGITKNPNDDNYMMVMEFAKLGSLRKLLDSKYNDLDWKFKVTILYYISDGLNTIHNANLVHKDFHSGNIVNKDMYNSYITDFGLCKPLSQDSSTEGIFGVIPYIAPEVLYTGGKKYTKKSDIYSFGIIMSEVFTGYPPYHDIPHDENLVRKVCLGHRPEIKCEVPQLLLDLMNKCLDAEPQNRPTAKELKNMLDNFFFDFKNEKTEFYKQVKEIRDSGKNLDQATSIRLNYQTHKQAIYTSRHFNYKDLPEPINANQVSKPVERPNFD